MDDPRARHAIEATVDDDLVDAGVGVHLLEFSDSQRVEEGDVVVSSDEIRDRQKELVSVGFCGIVGEELERCRRDSDAHVADALESKGSAELVPPRAKDLAHRTDLGTVNRFGGLLERFFRPRPKAHEVEGRGYFFHLRVHAVEEEVAALAEGQADLVARDGFGLGEFADDPVECIAIVGVRSEDREFGFQSVLRV